MSPIVSALATFRSGEGLKGQLLRGGVGSIAIKIGATGLNVLLAIVLARTLGAEEFGVYSFIFALITIMAIPAQMGLPNLVVRETAKARAAGDWALMKGLWRWSTLMALMMSAALMAMGALAAWAFSNHLPEGGLTVFYWGLVLVPLVALGNLRGAALRGLRHVVRGQLPEFILRPAFLIALVLGAHFGLSAHALTASDAMMLHAVASLVAFGIGAWMLLRARPQQLSREPRSKTHPRMWVTSAVPMGMNEGIHAANANIGLIVLGLFATPEDVGLFRIAFLGAALVTVAHLALDTVVDPYISSMYAAGEKGKLQRLLTITARIDMAIALPLVFVLIVLGSWLLDVLFGADFVAAYPALIILTLGFFFNVAAGPAGQLLIMSGHERSVFSTVAISATTIMVLIFPFTSLWGMVGTATAIFVGRSIMCALFILQAHRKCGINTTVFVRNK